jgi:hypothetical protein
MRRGRRIWNESDMDRTSVGKGGNGNVRKNVKG